MRNYMIGLVVCLWVCGCSYTAPSDRTVIHANYLNATSINEKVQKDATLPAYAKTWWAAEEKVWQAMDSWSKGEAFPKN
jgi:hypothetical protein